MTGKYVKFDQKLLNWLSSTSQTITTQSAAEALGVADDKTKHRHISRRFTQLEDRGVLSCTLHGTTRVCTLKKLPPDTLSKTRWKPSLPPAPTEPVSTGDSIPAADSFEYEARGGYIERIPSHWDTRCTGSLRLGDSFEFDE